MLMQQEKLSTVAPRPPLRFACAQSRLNQGLSLVSHAVSKSSIDTGKMPLLGYIRMEVRDGMLILSATNLEISITTKLELTEKEEIQEGVVAVPARLFTELVSKMPDGRVKISVEAESLMLSLEHARGVAEIKCLSAEEFLPIPNAEDGELPILLPVTPLKEIIRAVSIAAARDETLPALACIFVHVDKNKLTFAATDRFRTAHQHLQMPVPNESNVTYDLLIPQRSLAELTSILPAEGMVMMSVTPNRGQVIFHTQWMAFSSRLIEGTFPNYLAAIPSKEQRRTHVIAKTAEFKEIVQLASIYANAVESGAICLSIKGSLGMEPGRLSVTSERAEIGSGQNVITAAVEGDDQEPINFSARLLLDALNVTTTTEVVLEIGHLRIKDLTAYAGVLRPVGSTCTHSFMSLVTKE